MSWNFEEWQNSLTPYSKGGTATTNTADKKLNYTKAHSRKRGQFDLLQVLYLMSFR
jgi:hypothetical protein